MQQRMKQSGATLWEALITISVIVFFMTLAFKLIPAYLIDIKVESTLEHVAALASQSSMSSDEIKRSIENQFSIEDVRKEHVDLHTALKISASSAGRILEIKYERIIHFAKNAYILLKFEHRQTIRFE